MSGVEVRVVQVHSSSAALGSEGADAENGGAVELWRDGERIVELTWWEEERPDIASLGSRVELNANLTYSSDVRCRLAAVQARRTS